MSRSELQAREEGGVVLSRRVRRPWLPRPQEPHATTDLLLARRVSALGDKLSRVLRKSSTRAGPCLPPASVCGSVRGARGEQLGHGAGAPMNGVKKKKKTQEAPSALLPGVGGREPSASQGVVPAGHRVCRRLDRGLPASGAERVEHLSFTSHTTHGILRRQPRRAGTPSSSADTRVRGPCGAGVVARDSARPPTRTALCGLILSSRPLPAARVLRR